MSTLEKRNIAIEKRADRAFALEKELIAKKEDINLTFLDIGKILFEIREDRLHVELGFENITDWFSTLGISVRMAWYLISIHEFFVVKKKVKTSSLKKIDVTKLFDILAIVKKKPNTTNEWLDKARELRTIDLRKELKEERLKLQQQVIDEPLKTDIQTDVGDSVGNNSIILGSNASVLNKIADNSIDAMIFAPPTIPDEDAITVFSDKIKKSGQILVFVDHRNCREYLESLREKGFSKVRILVWKKPNFSKPANINSLSFQHELILCGSRDKLIYNLNEIRGDVWEYDSKSVYGHDREKPVALLEELIEMSTNVGDLIFNPFSGSGEVLSTAKRLNRKFIGVEPDKYWHKMCLKRVDEVNKL